MNNGIVVLDSTAYIDNQWNKIVKFTTLSLKKKTYSVWNDFWNSKLTVNKRLIEATQKGDTKKLIKLLNKLRKAEEVADINYCDSTGLSALHYAALFNQYEAMKILLYSGDADINMHTLNSQAQTTLHIAC
jgi:hypothetical protein